MKSGVQYEALQNLQALIKRNLKDFWDIKNVVLQIIRESLHFSLEKKQHSSLTILSFLVILFLNRAFSFRTAQRADFYTFLENLIEKEGLIKDRVFCLSLFLSGILVWKN